MLWRSDSTLQNKGLKKILLALSLSYFLVWGLLIWFADFELLLGLKLEALREYFPNWPWLVFLYVQFSRVLTILLYLAFPIFLFRLISHVTKATIAFTFFILLLVSPSLIPSIKNLAKVKYQFTRHIQQEDFGTCPNTPIALDSNEKYAHHQSYESFLIYLSDQIESTTDPFVQTDIIRREVASLIDLGEFHTCLSNQGDDWSLYSQEKFYELFMYDKASVYCGGTSLFLMRVFEDLGFQADRYDMGTADASHQTTVVYLDSINQWIVQDAYFNGTFRNSETNSPIEFSQLLDTSYHANIVFQQDEYPFPPDYLLEDKCQDIQGTWAIASLSTDTVYRLTNNSINFKHFSPRTLANFIADSTINSRYLKVLHAEFGVNEFNEKSFLLMFSIPKNMREKELLRMLTHEAELDL